MRSVLLRDLTVVSSSGCFFFPLLGELDDGGGEGVEDRVRLGFGSAETSEVENSGGALLNAGGAADALWIFHGLAFVGKVHDVDALVADRGADVTGDTLVFICEDAEFTEGTSVNLHESGERAGKAAPDAAGEVEVE